MTCFEFLAHIHDLDGRQIRFDNAIRQIQFLNLFCLGLISLFNCRRGRTQHAHCAAQTRIFLRSGHRMIERRLGLMKRRVVTFIRNDQADIRQWREQGTARANDDFEFSRRGAPPGIISLALRKFRMDDAHLPGEATKKRRTVCGVSAISGTRMIACLPRLMTPLPRANKFPFCLNL